MDELARGRRQAMTGLPLTIVVVTHNSEACLPRTLDALGPVHLPRVLAVDNGSTDATRAILARYRVPMLVNATNVGFARAANRAARAAGSAHLCFLNPDCEAPTALLAEGVSALGGRPRRCVSPAIDGGAGEVFTGAQPGYTRLKLVDDMLRSNYGDPAFCARIRAHPGYHDRRWSWPHGACFFVNRADFVALGGFDHRYFLYMEDVDFGRRLCAAGGEVVSIAGTVRHVGGQGADIDRRRRASLLNAGRIQYARLQYGRAFAALLASIAAPAAARRSVLEYLRR
jgi:GT2 family glycosyltransferase